MDKDFNKILDEALAKEMQPAKRRLIDKDQFIHDVGIAQDMITVIMSIGDGNGSGPIVQILNILRQLIEIQPEVEV